MSVDSSFLSSRSLSLSLSTLSSLCLGPHPSSPNQKVLAPCFGAVALPRLGPLRVNLYFAKGQDRLLLHSSMLVNTCSLLLPIYNINLQTATFSSRRLFAQFDVLRLRCCWSLVACDRARCLQPPSAHLPIVTPPLGRSPPIRCDSLALAGSRLVLRLLLARVATGWKLLIASLPWSPPALHQA